MSLNAITPDKEHKSIPYLSDQAGSPVPPPVTEWVEIIEPRTKEHMYANLTTGECVWDPPPGVHVKRTNENQWWELFDQNTARFYYYNATTQVTVWHRPANCDIIPLAKLQTLKQNTQVRPAVPDVIEEDETGEEDTVTSSSGHRKKKRRDEKSSQTNLSSALDRPSTADRRTPLRLSTSSQAQTSPIDSPKSSSRRRHHYHRHHVRQMSQPQLLTSKVPTAETEEDVVLRKVSRRGGEDQMSSKYYSVPHRGDTSYSVPVSKQRSLEGEQFKQMVQQQQQQPPRHQMQEATTPTSSISRSVSFMGGRQPRVQVESGTGTFGSSSWRASFDSGGRRSVESTPQSSRRMPQQPHSPVYSSLRSPSEKGSIKVRPLPPTPSGSIVQEATTQSIEGYCTPMINRKLSAQYERSDSGFSGSTASGVPVKAKPQPKPRTFINSQGSPPLKTSQLPKEPSTHMSISQLVDSGMSALRDGNGNNDTIVGNNNQSKKFRRKDSGSKMSPLQMYILEQAKMSGYRLRGGETLNGDRDSYIESEDDRGRESDDFADDEEDEWSIAESSINGEEEEDENDEDRYLSEPTYNNLDPNWLKNLGKMSSGPTPTLPPPQPAPRTQIYPPHAQRTMYQSPSSHNVDAFSEEFDLRMRFGSQARIHSSPGQQQQASSTMPRPTSHSGGGLPQLPPSGIHPTSSHLQQNPSFPVPYEVIHPSLQRNAHSLVVDHATSAALAAAVNSSNKHQSSNQLSTIDGRPQFQRGSSLSVSLHSTGGGESDIEKYAQDNMNIQKKGIFRKKMTVKDILSWTDQPIRKPLTCITDKALKKEAIEIFRLVQIYMGDRKAKQGMSVNSVALDIACFGYSKAPIRDEIYVQLCKQTTDNPKKESLRRGWELTAICLSFFPPSMSFCPCLFGYISKHRDPSLDEYHDVNKWPIHVQISHYASICSRRLERIGVGGRLSPRKPTVDDIDQSRLQIFRPSMFGGTLSETLDIQRDKYPHLQLPWILTALSDQIIRLNGLTTEGIFRVPADLDEVNSVKCRFDQWEAVLCSDCHTAASLLKLWFRELYEPLVPDDFYDEAIHLASQLESQTKDSSPEHGTTLQKLLTLVQRLPHLNRLVLSYLIHFLQLFARPEAASVTKMDASNLATVFAPNCLRCPSTDPSVILENTRKEMAFVKSLILHLDTSSIEGIV